MILLSWVHEQYIHRPRVETLLRLLVPLLPANASVLDVGSGDGLLARRIADARPDCRVEGIDVLVRPNTRIPMKRFDGHRIPYDDKSVDVVMFVDVLHHCEDPSELLREAARVARVAVVIKDHSRDGLLAGPTLHMMDWVGNAHHGVVLPYNYWTTRKWRETLAQIGLGVEQWEANVKLYPRVLNWLFGRSLHFTARLRPQSAGS